MFALVGAGLNLRFLSAASSCATVALSTVAMACSPTVPPAGYVKPTLSDFSANAVSRAAVVADVEIVSVEEINASLMRVIKFKLKSNYKGDLPASGTFVQPMSACDHMFEVFQAGRPAMVFLSSDKESVYPHDFYLPHHKSSVAEYVRHTPRESNAN